MKEALIKLSKGSSENKLILFPFLGGSSTSFKPLIQALNQRMDLEIWIANPPGRGGSPMPLMKTMDQVVTYYGQAYERVAQGGSTYILGHSMGGMIAYHMLKALDGGGKNHLFPKGLILSACGPGETLDRAIYSQFPNDALLHKLCQLGAMPEEIMNSLAFQELFIPIFKADYEVMESIMNYSPDKALDVKVHQLCGALDVDTPHRRSLKWLPYFSRPLETRVIRGGGHMFINDHCDQVAQYVQGLVEGVL